MIFFILFSCSWTFYCCIFLLFCACFFFSLFCERICCDERICFCLTMLEIEKFTFFGVFFSFISLCIRIFLNVENVKKQMKYIKCVFWLYESGAYVYILYSIHITKKGLQLQQMCKLWRFFHILLFCCYKAKKKFVSYVKYILFEWIRIYFTLWKRKKSS